LLKKPTEQATKSTPIKGFQLYSLRHGPLFGQYHATVSLQVLCWLLGYNAIKNFFVVKSTRTPCTQIFMQVDKLNTVRTSGV